MYSSLDHFVLNASASTTEIKVMYIHCGVCLCPLYEGSTLYTFEALNQQRRIMGTDNGRKRICQKLMVPHAQFEMLMSYSERNTAINQSVLTSR